ncbi:MAG TPA: M36 family metallopeptidase [Actinophytocola sp.]|uniref:M36 family metallopeptidase n=1 Tax=Actinophytocola sp. TaxID=1872138 RepID=UPI002DB9F0B3|nr:M36 family metallopeptidase [Actinophytocola sp.]HEU5471047.1 M36 family metallopeptidase [Actinophytocola sp.]
MRLRRLVTAAGIAALAAPLTGIPAQAAPAPDGLRLLVTHQSLLATHEWYVQTFAGHDVLGSFYARHVDRKTGRVSVADGRVEVGGLDAAATPRVGAEAARAAASGPALSTEVAVLPGKSAKLVYAVLTDGDAGARRTIVDAVSGSVLKVESPIKHVDGTGQVFSPNPVADLQAQALTDQRDQNRAVPDVAYHRVTLSNLDGSGSLSGDFSRNVDPRGRQARSATNTFVYLRESDFFEQVMSYWGQTEAQKYIQRLGFTDVNNEPQEIKTTGFPDDNSFYDPSVDRITMGTGGVDDAEDAEVIWHEYGHAIQDAQVPNFGDSIEAGSIGEAFGDWWAMIMSAPLQRDTAITPLACIADWDSVSYTSDEPHCLRRTDTDLTYADRIGQVHFDGQIWSRALNDVFRALGRDRSATIVLESQFSFTPTITMAAAAQVTVDTAQALFGAADAATVRAAFQARGII